jgi:hypothetical protein
MNASPFCIHEHSVKLSIRLGADRVASFRWFFKWNIRCPITYINAQFIVASYLPVTVSSNRLNRVFYAPHADSISKV